MTKLILHILIIIVFSSLAWADPVVYVDAEKISSHEIEASRSAVALDEANLQRKFPATVADVLREIPGLEVVRQGGVGQTTSIFIRGAKSESTLVLIDGIEANDVMSPSSGFDFSTLSPNNIVRVEVYRGPQSVRFGAGALGGVINIITKEGAGPFGVDYLLEAGSYETYRAAVGVNSQTGEFGYAVSTETFKTGGFSAASGAGAVEDDGAEIGSVSGKVTYRPNAKTHIEATTRYSKAEVELDRGGGEASDDPNNDSRGDQFISGLSGQSRFLDDRLLSKLGFYLSEIKRSSDNYPDTSNTDTSLDYFESQNYKIESSQEYSLKDEHKIRLDIQWRVEEGEGTSSFNGTETVISEKDQSVLGEGLTYFYEDEFWFGDVGLRSDQTSDHDEITSSRASFGRFLSGRTSKAYLSYGTGFKLPSLYQLYSSYGTLGLDYENSQTVEATIEGSLSPFDKSSFTVFNNNFRDMIDYDTTTNKYLNIAKSRSRGFEVQSQVHPSAEWSLKSSFTYLNSTNEKTGLQLLRRPRRVFSLQADYEHDRWQSYLKYTYRGARADGDPVTLARLTNGSYSLVELGFEYKLIEQMSLKARIENTFDKKYEEAAGYNTSERAIYAGIAGRL